MKKLLAVAALLGLLALRADSGVVLEATTDSLEVVTSTAVGIDYDCSWTDNTTSAFTPGKSAGAIASATTTTIVAAPAASTQRNIIGCTLRNTGTSANTLTIQRDVSATNRTMFQATLAAGEVLSFSQNNGWGVYTAAGIKKEQATDISGYSGRLFGFAKTGTAEDSAGYWIAYAKDAGYPGAYVLGTPGLNGYNTDCSVASQTSPAGAAQTGSHLLQDPATGSLYLTHANIASSTIELIELVDPLWYNTGIVVTTLTAQAITMGALPARDINGSSNGEGVYAALLTTTANTNAAVINGTTLSYTDSEGNAGNTATFSAIVGWQAPATPVIGTWMRFQLAAGDRGIRSVQSITLTTSYGAGALSLVLYRPLADIPNLIAYTGGVVVSPQFFPAPGIRLYNDTCIWATTAANATASSLAGSYSVMER
jgi:hypothetical protein